MTGSNFGPLDLQPDILPTALHEELMDGTLYTDVILRDMFLPYIKTAFPGGYRFIQDNCLKYKSKMAKEFMQTSGINWLSTWPSGISFLSLLLFCT